METKKAKAGDSVKVHYTGRFEDGEVFDSSKGKEPLAFTLNSGQIIPGFEEAVLDMAVGESKTVSIKSENAYGAYKKELILSIPKTNFPKEIKPEVGQMLQMTDPNNQPVAVQVIEITEEAVTLDANHPLAGKDLIFDIELVEIS